MKKFHHFSYKNKIQKYYIIFITHKSVYLVKTSHKFSHSHIGNFAQQISIKFL